MDDTSSRNPLLSDLADLAGDWDMEISHASFLPSPEEKVHGFVSIGWIESGGFLALHQGAKAPDAPTASWVIGRDEPGSEYTVLYFDSRNVSRVYRMSFVSRLWKLWRNTDEFSQRFEGRLSDDRATITGFWEKSFNGRTWGHDFDVIYRKER